MFSEIEINRLEKSVFEDRLTSWKNTEVVLTALIEKYEFGQGFFHKTLSKSILRPGSLQSE